MHLLRKIVSEIRQLSIARLALFQIFFLFAATASYGQKIGFSGGVNKNNYFDFIKEEDGHFESDYHPGNGYSFAISIADIKIDSFMPLRLALLFDHYKGSFYTGDGGLSYGEFTRANVVKTTIGLGIYPLNFSVLK